MTLADLAGERLSISLVSKIERGRVQPSLATLDYLANRLGMTAEELLRPDVLPPGVTEESRAEPARSGGLGGPRGSTLSAGADPGAGAPGYSRVSGRDGSAPRQDAHSVARDAAGGGTIGPRRSGVAQSLIDEASAALALSTGDPAAAVAALAAAAPISIDALALRAAALQALGREDEALAEAAAVLRASDSAPAPSRAIAAARLVRGRVEARRGRLDSAQLELRAALELTPTAPSEMRGEILAELAAVTLAAGARATARNLLAQAQAELSRALRLTHRVERLRREAADHQRAGAIERCHGLLAAASELAELARVQTIRVSVGEQLAALDANIVGHDASLGHRSAAESYPTRSIRRGSAR